MNLFSWMVLRKDFERIRLDFGRKDTARKKPFCFTGKFKPFPYAAYARKQINKTNDMTLDCPHPLRKQSSKNTNMCAPDSR